MIGANGGENMNLRKTVTVFSIALAILCGTKACAATLMEEGLDHFQAKRYYAAEDCFNRALAAEPNNQMYYYYLGQTLERLCDAKAAKAAYENCFRINPFSVQGLYAKHSITELSARMEEQAHAAADTPQITAKTIQEIKRQTNDARNRYGQWGNLGARWSLDKGNREAERLGYYERMTVRGINNGRYGGYNNGDDVSNLRQIRTNWIRSDAQVQGLKYQAAAAKAAYELQNSAANLEILLAEKKRPGEAKLRALGTDLYVRYYGNDDHEPPAPPQDPPIELHATQLKLSAFADTPPQLSRALQMGYQLTEREEHRKP